MNSTARPNVKGHGAWQQHYAVPAFSSNGRNFKTHIVPLDIHSEATADETDVESLSESYTGSLCTSPTCPKESSSDENAKLLVQKFDSSKYPLLYTNRAQEKHHGTLQVQPSHKVTATKNDKAGVKVSFQGEAEASAATEHSCTRMYNKQVELSMITEEGAASSATRKDTKFVKANNAPKTSSRSYRKPRSETAVQPSESALKPPLPGLSYTGSASVSSSTASLLRKSSKYLGKVQGFIRQLWQRSFKSLKEKESIQAELPDTNMDDVNEMKALLNTINHNLKMLETRSKAHPQLLSSKLAPVYFTT